MAYSKQTYQTIVGTDLDLFNKTDETPSQVRLSPAGTVTAGTPFAVGIQQNNEDATKTAADQVSAVEDGSIAGQVNIDPDGTNNKLTIEVTADIIEASGLTIKRGTDASKPLELPDGTAVTELLADTRFYDIVEGTTVFFLRPKGGAVIINSWNGQMSGNDTVILGLETDIDINNVFPVFYDRKVVGTVVRPNDYTQDAYVTTESGNVVLKTGPGPGCLYSVVEYAKVRNVITGTDVQTSSGLKTVTLPISVSDINKVMVAWTFKNTATDTTPFTVSYARVDGLTDVDTLQYFCVHQTTGQTSTLRYYILDLG